MALKFSPILFLIKTEKNTSKYERIYYVIMIYYVTDGSMNDEFNKIILYGAKNNSKRS